MISPAYYGVCIPDFLKLGNFTEEKFNTVLGWCNRNCKEKFIPSRYFPWAFLSEDDAKDFQKEFGGYIKYKPEQIIND